MQLNDGYVGVEVEDDNEKVEYEGVEDENEDPKKLEVIYSTNILHRKKS